MSYSIGTGLHGVTFVLMWMAVRQVTGRYKALIPVGFYLLLGFKLTRLKK